MAIISIWAANVETAHGYLMLYPIADDEFVQFFADPEAGASGLFVVCRVSARKATSCKEIAARQVPRHVIRDGYT